jgi:hypothetical protein
MMTLAQWKDARRVDHVSIPVINTNMRFRDPNQRPDLKMFDPLLTAFATAPTELDRVMALGDILDLTAAFLGNAGGANRYQTPVQALQNSATQDLNARFGLYANAIRQDIITFANGQALTQKHLNVNVYFIAPVGANPNLGPIDAIINGHIATANLSSAFQDAHVTVARTNAVATVITQNAANESLLLTDPPAPNNMAGKFQDSSDGGAKLIQVSNASGAAGVDVVYVDEFDQNDIQGRTFRVGQNYFGETANRPIVTVRVTPAVGGMATHATTLVHELGHAVSSNAEHTNDGDNLMASGAVRNGNNRLKSSQIGWYRNNPWVV